MAGTPFLEIYTRAITEFQDPQLKALYKKNVVLFAQVMNNFMTNAISLFTNPLPVRKRLSQHTQPYEVNYAFTGDGMTNTFPLDSQIKPEDVELLLFTVKIDDKVVPSEYLSCANSIKIEVVPPIGSNVKVECFYPGQFDIDLYEDEKYILSQWVMVCWSEYVENNKLDIDRLLGDTDFNLSSNSTTTQSKTSWYIVNRETVTKRMSKYAWDAAIMRIYG